MRQAASVFISVSLPLEPLVGVNLVTRDKW